MQTSDETMKRLEELSRMATSPPWNWDTHDTNDVECTYVAVHRDDGRVILDSCNSEIMCIESEYDEGDRHHVDRMGAANLALVAEMRNALPSLLADLASVKAEVERLNRVLIFALEISSRDIANRIMAEAGIEVQNANQ